MKKDSLIKEIDIVSNEKNHIWTTFLISASGTLALIFSLNNIIKIIFLVIGLVTSSFLFLIYFKKNDQLDSLLNKLEKEQ